MDIANALQTAQALLTKYEAQRSHKTEYMKEYYRKNPEKKFYNNARRYASKYQMTVEEYIEARANGCKRGDPRKGSVSVVSSA